MGAVLIAGASVDTANTVADFCWLNTKPRQINILEAEAVVRGLTESMKYFEKEDELTIVIDSKTAYSWVKKALGGDIFRCQSLSGPLLVRRLSIIHDLAEDIKSVEVVWVPSEENPADLLTRVNQRWVQAMRQYTDFDWDLPEKTQMIAAVKREDENMRKRIGMWQNGYESSLGERGGIEVNGLLCVPHRSRRGVFLPMIPGENMEKYLRIRHVELGHLGTSGLWTAMREEASFPDGQLADKIKSVVADCRTCCQKRRAAYEESQGTIWGR